MEILPVVLLAVPMVALFVFHVVTAVRRPPLPAPPAPADLDPWGAVVARRGVVNLKSGRAIDGLLVRRDGPLLFLRNAVLLEAGSEPAIIDGEAVVHTSEVDFIQALGEGR